MIKIIKTLCEYFSESQKMYFSSKVKDLRNKLLQNCNLAIYRLETAEERVSTPSPDISTISAPPEPQTVFLGTAGTQEHLRTIKFKITDSEIMNSLMILTHGVLIQELERFLYDIFVEGVILYSRGYDLGDINHKFSLKNLKPTIELAEMREKITSEIERSMFGYDKLLKQSRKLFKLDEPELLEEIKKHVQIRHIFQHNRGIVRGRDIEDNGKRPFEILNENEEIDKYEKGIEIRLSNPEIKRLYRTIEEYSEKFQIQAKKYKQRYLKGHGRGGRESFKF